MIFGKEIIEDKFSEMLAQHSAYLYRASSHASVEMQKVFSAEVRSMLGFMQSALQGLSDAELKALASGKYTTDKLKGVKQFVDGWQKSMAAKLPSEIKRQAIDLAEYESDFIARALGKATATSKHSKLTGAELWDVARSVPLTGGYLVDDMVGKISTGAKDTVLNTLRHGITTGMSDSEIIKALQGTEALNYTDSTLQAQKTSLTTVVRTLRTHVSNQTYLQNYRDAGVKQIAFVAVLDSRTSIVCASHDGEVYDIDEPFLIPPMHHNCRSLLKPVFGGKQLGMRKANGSNGQKKVGANTNFTTWFARQSEDFQREWLGASRYELYKNGGYTLDRFVDPLNRTYSLQQLKILDEKTFKELGL